MHTQLLHITWSQHRPTSQCRFVRPAPLAFLPSGSLATDSLVAAGPWWRPMSSSPVCSAGYTCVRYLWCVGMSKAMCASKQRQTQLVAAPHRRLDCTLLEVEVVRLLGLRLLQGTTGSNSHGRIRLVPTALSASQPAKAASTHLWLAEQKALERAAVDICTRMGKHAALVHHAVAITPVGWPPKHRRFRRFASPPPQRSPIKDEAPACKPTLWPLVPSRTSRLQKALESLGSGCIEDLAVAHTLAIHVQ